jgi:pimeloyl-ACP methyl ester carboxylesterase
MHNSVVCAEDMPYVDPVHVDRRVLAATYMGAAQLDGLQAVCEHWPRGVMDADLHAPLVSSTPALLLSGSDDPVTPPVYAAQAALGFRDRLHIVMAGLGHSQLAAPCLEHIMAVFIEAGTARGLDASCAKHVRPMPFFTSLAGPEP